MTRNAGNLTRGGCRENLQRSAVGLESIPVFLPLEVVVSSLTLLAPDSDAVRGRQGLERGSLSDLQQLQLVQQGGVRWDIGVPSESNHRTPI